MDSLFGFPFIEDRHIWGDGIKAFGADALFFSPATFPWDKTFGNVKAA